MLCMVDVKLSGEPHTDDKPSLKTASKIHSYSLYRILHPKMREKPNVLKASLHQKLLRYLVQDLQYGAEDAIKLLNHDPKPTTADGVRKWNGGSGVTHAPRPTTTSDGFRLGFVCLSGFARAFGITSGAGSPPPGLILILTRHAIPTIRKIVVPYHYSSRFTWKKDVTSILSETWAAEHSKLMIKIPECGKNGTRRNASPGRGGWNSWGVNALVFLPHILLAVNTPAPKPTTPQP
ncbi:unnamed protein product [Nezara viridula]|uniref:Uncharacterized protein n=1 Tax=Nezara viridula TaxID=85310 RepID=A0A9P0E4F1_NEZVI|nr:unnamed protein product [Nezara viridula]